MSSDLRCIEPLKNSYRVRVKHQGQLVTVGTFPTYDAALTARNEHERQFTTRAVAYDSIDVPQNVGPSPFADPVLTIPTSNVLVLADLHVPYHNRDLLRRAIFVTRARHPQITTVAIIGDLFDFDSLSRHPHNGPDTDPDTAMECAGDVLLLLAKHFTQVYICSGNHDERLARKLDRQFSLERLIYAALGGTKPDADLHISNLDYLYVTSQWVIGHPSSYSGTGGKLPGDLADVYGRSVITAHNHLVGYSTSKSGRYIGIDSGHLTDPDRHYYVRRRLTKFTRWQGGFVVLSNGYPTMYPDLYTDWHALGCPATRLNDE